MNRADLDKLEQLLGQARRVIPMREVADGDMSPEAIGLRHDVDDNKGSFETAFEIAEWENERGWRSTFYLLHDSHYWEQACEQAQAFELMGHEVGIHVNAIAEGLRQRRNPEIILGRAIDQLRAAGCDITGCVAHGDPLCYQRDRTLRFVNDEMFTETARPSVGAATRLVETDEGWGFYLEPVSRREFGLTYNASWLPKGDYLSDSGNKWSQPIETVAGRWPHAGQLHVLMHPDWYVEAFAGAPV